MILVDSNVIIDVIERDPVWHDWSFAQIEAAVIADQVVINPVVIAEAAPRSGPLAQFENWLSRMLIEIAPLSNEAAYSAGQAFQSYRKKRQQGAASAILADFLIGGHAKSIGATVLTRDPRFYRAYFPNLPLITPSKDEAA